MALRRVLGATDAAWLVAGNMIGAGIFYTPGLVAAHLPGLVAPLVAWALGGLLALCGALVYAELGSRLPKAGGDYVYLEEAFGKLAGFLSGWGALLLTFSAAAALMCIVSVSYLQAAVGPIFESPLASRLLPPVLVVGLTWANVAGARFSGRTTALLTAIPLIGILALFGGGLLFGHADLVRPNVTLDIKWPAALGAAMIPVFFTYSGWNVAAYLAGEVRDPGRNLFRSLVGGTLAVTALYLVVNLVFLVVVPAEELAGSTIAGSLAVRQMLGPTAERWLSLIVAFAVLGSANVVLMAGGRIYYAMALDGLGPPALARTNAAGVPGSALWASGLWTALLSMTGKIEMLLNWATLAILLLSSLTVVSLFVLRSRGTGKPGYRCFGYPVVPALYLVACLTVAAVSARQQPMEALYGVLILASGVPVYLILRWKAGS